MIVSCGESFRLVEGTSVRSTHACLETRRLREDQTEVSKILNGYEHIDSNIFVHLRKRVDLWDHKVTLLKDRCRLDIGKYPSSQRTI